jgi:hypothetical protein
MHKLAGLTVVAMALVACSQERGEQTASEDLAAPDIRPSSAPGVAFRFSHDYSLDDDRISTVQEAHAASCEKLGNAKCRITGLTYNIDTRKRVSGMLQVKLDPAIARGFGKQATATVTQNGGELVRSEFSGEDVGTQVVAGQDRQADLQSRIADIDKRLASLKAGDHEATQLQAQLEQLRRELAEARSQVKEGQQQLAATPMTFNYFGEGGIAGFDENPIKASWRLMVESTVTMISIVLKVFGALLPWALLLLLLVALARSRPARAARDWWRRLAPMPKDDE